MVEKKRLSHPIEWSIKKSTREGIGSCKVATLGSIHCWTWCPGPARKGGMVFQPSCLLSPEPAGTLHTTVGSQSPDTNLGAVKLSALAQLLGCSPLFPVTSKARSRPPVSLNNWVPGVDRGVITCFVTSLQIPHGARRPREERPAGPSMPPDCMAPGCYTMPDCLGHGIHKEITVILVT